MQVGDLHRIFDRFVAVFVASAVSEAVTNAAAGHPQGKSFGVVIASFLTLRIRCSSKFSTPYNERIVEQASLIEIG